MYKNKFLTTWIISEFVISVSSFEQEPNLRCMNLMRRVCCWCNKDTRILDPQILCGSIPPLNAVTNSRDHSWVVVSSFRFQNEMYLTADEILWAVVYKMTMRCYLFSSEKSNSLEDLSCSISMWARTRLVWLKPSFHPYFKDSKTLLAQVQKTNKENG